jgi:hypothetical protein
MRGIGRRSLVPLSYFVSVLDYEQCQFSDRIIEVRPAEGSLIDLETMRRATPRDRHIRGEHPEVRLRKGSNYTRVDASEVKKLSGSWEKVWPVAATSTRASKLPRA